MTAGFFCPLQIRDAAWSVFKALPAVTSLGLTAVNGLTAVFNRGHSNEIEGFRGNFCLYSNDTNGSPVYYKEFVSEVTGYPLGPPSVQKLATALHETPWFQEAISHPLDNLTWTVGRSLISKKLCAVTFWWSHLFAWLLTLNYYMLLLCVFEHVDEVNVL